MAPDGRCFIVFQGKESYKLQQVSVVSVSERQFQQDCGSFSEASDALGGHFGFRVGGGSLGLVETWVCSVNTFERFSSVSHGVLVPLQVRREWLFIVPLGPQHPNFSCHRRPN